MSTLEQTVSMLESLPEDDLKAIHDMIISHSSQTKKAIKPLNTMIL